MCTKLCISHDFYYRSCFVLFLILNGLQILLSITSLGKYKYNTKKRQIIIMFYVKKEKKKKRHSSESPKWPSRVTELSCHLHIIMHTDRCTHTAKKLIQSSPSL